MAETEKTIGFRGSEEYRKRLQQAAFDRGLKVQGFLEKAVEAYLRVGPSRQHGALAAVPALAVVGSGQNSTGQTTSTKVSSDATVGEIPTVIASKAVTSETNPSYYQRLHGQLQRVLEGGQAEAIQAITTNLQAFDLLTTLAAHGNPSPPPQPKESAEDTKQKVERFRKLEKDAGRNAKDFREPRKRIRKRKGGDHGAA